MEKGRPWETNRKQFQQLHALHVEQITHKCTHKQIEAVTVVINKGAVMFTIPFGLNLSVTPTEFDI